MKITDYFARTYIINLPARADRRRETTQMLERVDLPMGPGRIEFFPAFRPDSPGEFKTIGARGVFLSHLAVVKKARDEGLPNVLVMEDDLEIDPKFGDLTDSLIAELESQDWGLVYFGHILKDIAKPPGHGLLVPYDDLILTTHFMGINGSALPRLVDFFETMLTRPGGHPDGGPMFIDGAYSTFRQQNPDVRTLVASPNLGWQRSSRSDISPRWFDSVPGLTTLAGLARKFRAGRLPSSS